MINSVFVNFENGKIKNFSVHYVTIYTDIIRNYSCLTVPESVLSFINSTHYSNTEYMENKKTEIYFNEH